MKNGSRKPLKAKDLAKVIKGTNFPEAPSQDPSQRAKHQALAPIPAEAAKDPVAWAEKHIESLAPISAKEMEWTVKFGSDAARYQAARDLLAMKGLTTKPKDNGAIPQAMVFVVGKDQTVTQAGVPVMPWSNAPAKLAPNVDNETDAIIVPETPTSTDKGAK